MKVARTNKDGSFQRDADNNIKYSTREYNQFHQFELNMEEATGKDGKPLVIEESAWGAYESGGILTQLKKPQTVRRRSCQIYTSSFIIVIQLCFRFNCNFNFGHIN